MLISHIVSKHQKKLGMKSNTIYQSVILVLMGYLGHHCISDCNNRNIEYSEIRKIIREEYKKFSADSLASVELGNGFIRVSNDTMTIGGSTVIKIGNELNNLIIDPNELNLTAINSIQMRSSDVKIDAYDGEIEFVAGVEIQSTVGTSQFKLNSSEIDMDAGGIININSQTTNVQGSGILNLDGGVTQIGGGGVPAARLGDMVVVDINSGIGTIGQGSPTVLIGN